MAQFGEIEIEKITLGEPNVRKIDVDLEIDELAKSIEEQGLLQPIIVHEINGNYELIAGQRRLTALIKLGRKTVPAMIVDNDYEDPDYAGNPSPKSASRISRASLVCLRQV